MHHPIVRLTPRTRGVLILTIQCLVVIACVLATTAAAATAQERQIRADTVERTGAVARSLAGLVQVQEAIGTPSAAAELQPLADLTAQVSQVDYVVITDVRGIRLTHPTVELRGHPVSTDPSTVLAGATYVGTETGTLGPTLRAKVPVYRDGEVVGTVSVGILESEIAADTREHLWALIPWILVATLVGCLAAAGLVALVNRRVRRLEDEVAELSVQRRIASALREQTHEFHTRMHILYGLIDGAESDAALSYIAETAPVTGSGSTVDGIDDSRLRALLSAAATELAGLGARLQVDPLSTVSAAVLEPDDLTVIANLVRNATEAVTDAVGPGGVVRVRILADESRVDITVGDNGPGIAADLLPRLFRRGASTKPGGADAERGVGLALVNRIVRRRGGHVDVGIDELGGAQFEVHMPTAPTKPIAVR